MLKELKKALELANQSKEQLRAAVVKAVQGGEDVEARVGRINGHTNALNEMIGSLENTIRQNEPKPDAAAAK